MPFKNTPQSFSAGINAVQIGTGSRAVTLGGENVLPFYSFDGEIANGPKVGVEIRDTGFTDAPKGVADFYAGCETAVDRAVRAAAMEGADFLCLYLEGADPAGQNRSVEECVEIVKEVSSAIDLPLVVMGCKNDGKDIELLNRIAEALSDQNVLVLSAKEENYGEIGKMAGMICGQKVGAESSVDINLAKQLNVLMTQQGVDPGSIVMDVGSASVGYGFEYVASTMERIRLAALGQNDKALQMPVITPVSCETWGVKESTALEADMPEWGDREERCIDMEVVTAAACLAAGSHAVILRHPASVKTISTLIRELV